MKSYIRKLGFVISLVLIILILILNTAAVLNSLDKKTGSFGNGDRFNVILDPGHGGEDGGAVSITGTAEKDINLAVALKTEKLLAFCGVPAIMTRTGDDIDYPPEAETTRLRKAADTRARTELINSTPDALLVSIHQNKYGKENGVKGAQVFYASTEMSQILAGEVTERLGLAAGIVRPPAEITGGVYIMTHIQCPAILVECGFLSNREEAELLESDSYQKKLSAAIAAGLLDFMANHNGGAYET